MLGKSVCSKFAARLLQSFACLLCALLSGSLLAGRVDPGAGPASSAVCAACHGSDGNSVASLYPSIAGQHKAYLLAQLRAIKSGERSVPLMAGQLDAMSDQDLQELAAYYSSQRLAPGAARDTPDLAAAEQIYRGGVRARGVAACAACHSPEGQGNGPAAFPRIAGQIPDYIETALRAYRDGQRQGVLTSSMMPEVAAGLSDREIRALANYIHGLR